MNCPKCNAEAESNSNFCDQCATPLTIPQSGITRSAERTSAGAWPLFAFRVSACAASLALSLVLLLPIARIVRLPAVEQQAFRGNEAVKVTARYLYPKDAFVLLAACLNFGAIALAGLLGWWLDRERRAGRLTTATLAAAGLALAEVIVLYWIVKHSVLD